MREILFRGKRTDNGEWVDGYLAAYDLICPNYPEDTSNATGDYYGQTPYVGFVEVEPSTVVQYTGLNDKNGKRIFEGDILHISKISDGLGSHHQLPLDYPVNVVVKWDLCAWMWETLCDDKRYINFPDAWCHYECEVIGNIHDNKLEDFYNGR